MRFERRAPIGFTLALCLVATKGAFAQDPPPHAAPEPPPASETPRPPPVGTVSAAEATLLKQAASAQQAAQLSADKATAAADEVATTRSGKLISSGITGGIAGIAHLALDNAIRTTDIGTMPYVMVHPAYWFSSQELRTYCASNWSLAGDEDAAARAALGIARKKAERAFEASRSALRPLVLRRGQTDEAYRRSYKDWVGTTFISSTQDHPDARRSIVDNIESWLVDNEAQAMSGDLKAAEKLTAERAAIVDFIATLYWNPIRPGKCGGHKLFGLWVGIPLPFSTITELGRGIGSDARMKREVSPTVAFGYGVSLNAYLSFLAGASINTVERAANPATGAAADQVTAWTLVAGVGGNIDILTLLKP